MAESCFCILFHKGGQNKSSALFHPLLLFPARNSSPASCHPPRDDCSSLLCSCKIQWLPAGVSCALRKGIFASGNYLLFVPFQLFASDQCVRAHAGLR